MNFNPALEDRTTENIEFSIAELEMIVNRPRSPYAGIAFEQLQAMRAELKRREGDMDDMEGERSFMRAEGENRELSEDERIIYEL